MGVSRAGDDTPRVHGSHLRDAAGVQQDIRAPAGIPHRRGRGRDRSAKGVFRRAPAVPVPDAGVPHRRDGSGGVGGLAVRVRRAVLDQARGVRRRRREHDDRSVVLARASGGRRVDAPSRVRVRSGRLLAWDVLYVETYPRGQRRRPSKRARRGGLSLRRRLHPSHRGPKGPRLFLCVGTVDREMEGTPHGASSPCVSPSGSPSRKSAHACIMRRRSSSLSE